MVKINPFTGQPEFVNGGSADAPWKIISGAYTTVAGDKLAFDTSGGDLLPNLPATPSIGDFIEFADAQGTWATHHLTVGGNGQLIMASATDLTCSTNGASFGLLFVGGATGWRVIQGYSI